MRFQRVTCNRVSTSLFLFRYFDFFKFSKILISTVFTEVIVNLSEYFCFKLEFYSKN